MRLISAGMLALTVGCNGSPVTPLLKAPTPTEVPTGVPESLSPACASAWDAVGAFDLSHDSASDLFPTIRACTLHDWRAGFDAHDAFGYSGPADVVLTRACFSPEIEDLALCKSVARR